MNMRRQSSPLGVKISPSARSSSGACTRYLIVYDPASQPLTIVAVLHGARDVEQILKDLT